MRGRTLDSALPLWSVLLVGLGLILLYSAGVTDVPSAASEIWKRQALWVGVGLVVAVFAFRVSPRILEWVTPAVYVGAVLLLALTLIIGTGAGTASGAKSWLAIGGRRLGQPAELAKLATVLMLARHLGPKREPPSTLTQLLPSLVIVGVPFMLVGLQPDLGSALVFVGLLFAMLFWAGVNHWLLLLLASPFLSLLMAFSTLSWGVWIVVLTIVLLWVRPYVVEGLVVWLVNLAMGLLALELWGRLAPYQQNRLLSFLNPEIDPRATGWHIIQSKVAIGSGGILGKGLTEGTQKRLAFLPEQHTDFVFSVLGEELGFLGVLASLTLFALLILSLIRISQRAVDPFSSLAVAGVCGILLTHIFVNVGMTVGIMPIVGIPLPFLSYGGSFLLVCFLALGLSARVAFEARHSGYTP
ncbi:MAG: rod shape-determining protein RodA [Gemmatimonadota bacterium]|nr:rod shape-determining protein RodA [Gemmatimonadota bacterium]MDH3368711.1 rod shape-determining protein RodA [Gemmatimonadota bacterium]MDH3478333.1 rod shape-determining protein RodA [Gemmatimonadota bacterium]MDH5549945.1 rod shape-determining protein RodA [Gemmatimonadota bacterium]